MDDDKQRGLPISEVVDFLHENASRPIARGFTAKEIVKLKTLQVEDWQKVWQEYRRYHRKFNAFPLIAISLIIACHWYLDSRWLLILAMYPIWTLSGRRSHAIGYEAGYEIGVEHGVNKTLGLSDQDAMKVGELAAEAEVWGIAAQSLNSKVKEAER